MEQGTKCSPSGIALAIKENVHTFWIRRYQGGKLANSLTKWISRALLGGLPHVEYDAAPPVDRPPNEVTENSLGPVHRTSRDATGPAPRSSRALTR